MVLAQDTIAAIATPVGKGSIGVVRVSGPKAFSIAEKFIGFRPRPRFAHFAHFRSQDGHEFDQGLVLYFPAPNSFTGDDVIEFQGHGGTYVLNRLLQEVILLGARLAQPGEFSLRAFLNRKIDLAQAEAIADLINASTEQAMHAAINTLRGDFSEAILKLEEALIQLRTYIEAAIDFAEEEIDFLSENSLQIAFKNLSENLKEIFTKASQGSILREGITVAIIGKPNVGKSSIMNALAGNKIAIVTPHPGTTRDLLREQIQINGIPLHLIDTAGLRNSEDPVEKEGIELAKETFAKASHLLIVTDEFQMTLEEIFQDLEINQHILEQFSGRNALTLVRNKIDHQKFSPALSHLGNYTEILLSALTHDGLDLLRQHLCSKVVGYQGESEGIFMARERHLEALRKSQILIESAYEALQTKKAGELAAEDLRLAQRELSSITGEFSSDDLLGRIFSSFCIGK